MQDFQDRGERYRQELGIDGTAGDAQDVDHSYKPDGENTWCLACGLAEKASIHNFDETNSTSQSIPLVPKEGSTHAKPN